MNIDLVEVIIQSLETGKNILPDCAMQPVERKPSLPAMTKTRLKEGLVAGEWKERLPAERPLSEHLNVSRPTLRIALLQLKQEGWLKGESRSGWIVLRKTRQPPSNIATKTIAFLSPQPLATLTSVGLFVFGDLSARFAPMGAAFHGVNTHGLSQQRLRQGLTKLYHETQADAWLLFRASSETQRFFAKQNRPTLLIGNPATGIDLPAVQVDVGAVAHHAASALLRFGHDPDRIRLIIPRSDLGGHRLITSGFAKALSPHLSANETENLILRHDEDHLDLLENITKALHSPQRPTGLIVLRTSACIELLGHLTYHLQCRLPDDLSLLSLEDAPFMSSSVPEITRYHFDYQRYSSKIFDQLSKALSGITIKHEHLPITPEMIPGETLGAYRV